MQCYLYLRVDIFTNRPEYILVDLSNIRKLFLFFKGFSSNYNFIKFQDPNFKKKHFFFYPKLGPERKNEKFLHGR